MPAFLNSGVITFLELAVSTANDTSVLGTYYAYYDYILAMDDSNIEEIQSIVGIDTDNKIYRLLDFTNKPRNIKDPWYTGNFDETYWDIVEGCDAFLKHLKL